MPVNPLYPTARGARVSCHVCVRISRRNAATGGAARRIMKWANERRA